MASPVIPKGWVLEQQSTPDIPAGWEIEKPAAPQPQQAGASPYGIRNALEDFASLSAGLYSGVENFRGGVKQAGMDLGAAVGAIPPEQAQQFTAEEAARRAPVKGYDSVVMKGLNEVNRPFAVGQFAGEIAPLAPFPGAVGKSNLARFLTAPAIGAAQAGLNFVEPGGDRATNIGVGALFASAFQLAPAAGAKLLRKFAGSEGTEDTVKAFNLAGGGGDEHLKQIELRRTLAQQGKWQPRLPDPTMYPSVGELGTDTAMTLQNAVGMAPAGATILRRHTIETMKKLDDRVVSLKASLGEAMDDTQAGLFIQGGLVGSETQRGFVKRFGIKAGWKYRALSRQIGKNTPAEVSNTDRMFQKLTAGDPSAPALSEELQKQGGENPILKLREAFEKDTTVPAMVAASNTKKMTFGTLQWFRREVGAKLSDATLTGTPLEGKYKQLYKAVSRDMEVAARAKGPAALAAFREANEFYAAGIAHQKGVFRHLANKANIDEIMPSIFSNVKKGHFVLGRLKESLTPEEYVVLSRQIIERMGESLPSDATGLERMFNPAVFMRHWRLMNDKTKRLLFSGTGLEGVAGSMESIADASAQVEQMMKFLPNPSGSAGGVGQIAAAGGVIGLTAAGRFKLAGALTATVITFGATAKAMTHPPFVKWLSQTTRLEGGSLARQIARLSAVAPMLDVETQAHIRDVLEGMSTAGEEQVY